MRTGMALSVFAAAVLLVGRPTNAQGWRGPHHGGAVVDLTAEQQKQLSELRAGMHQQMQPVRNEMFAKSSELRQLWLAPTPDRKAIQDKQQELDQLRKQMQDARTEHHLAALNVLTPAQREKAQAAGAGYGPGRGRGGGGHGRGMGPGMGPGSTF